MSDPASDYVLGTSDHELVRLTLQQEVWSGVTDAFLDRLGLAPGSRCLDAGCGPGLVTELLRERAGPSGHVLALDESPRWIEHLEGRVRAEGWGEVEPRRGRLQDVALEDGSLDLVWLRWVLSFLPDPGALVARLARALAPGGVLAVMDYNHEGVSLFPDSPGFRAAIRATRELYERAGGDVWVGARLPALFRAAGLETFTLEPALICGGPGSPAFRWADAFFPFHVDGMLQQGLLSPAERELFDAEWAAHRADPDALFFSPIVVCAAARQPASRA